MNNEQWEELLDLYVAGDLPVALQALVRERMESDPSAAEDVRTLISTRVALDTAQHSHPSDRFVERTLRGLLHANTRSDSNTRISAQ